MLWPKGIGIDCCITGIAFLKYIGNISIVYDFFCGYGTVLAVANVLHIHAVGVEISPKRCKKAKNVQAHDKIRSLSISRLSDLGIPKQQCYDLLHINTVEQSSSVVVAKDNLSTTAMKRDPTKVTRIKYNYFTDNGLEKYIQDIFNTQEVLIDNTEDEQALEDPKNGKDGDGGKDHRYGQDDDDIVDNHGDETS
jgi:hypothetical protein